MSLDGDPWTKAEWKMHFYGGDPASLKPDVHGVDATYRSAQRYLKISENAVSDLCFQHRSE